MWVENDLNEEESWSVVTKTYPQCQWDKAIYCAPDGEQNTMSEFGSDVLVYCIEAPMGRTKWVDKMSTRLAWGLNTGGRGHVRQIT
ncbi:hypothetical protein TNCV_4632341 [Trichonephila clavipes]|nr:hypothetical protein TNCV_4632341 [Trichonephila clavipes]